MTRAIKKPRVTKKPRATHMNEHGLVLTQPWPAASIPTTSAPRSIEEFVGQCVCHLVDRLAVSRSLPIPAFLDRGVRWAMRLALGGDRPPSTPAPGAAVL
jgi:hypothetical protein